MSQINTPVQTKSVLLAAPIWNVLLESEREREREENELCMPFVFTLFSVHKEKKKHHGKCIEHNILPNQKIGLV